MKMKKFILGLVVSLITTLSVQAQNVVAKYDTPKFFDNTYVAVNGGAITPTKGEASFEKYNGNAGLRVGKDISPIFGVALGSNAYFLNSGKVVDYLNTTVLAKVNVLNMFRTKLDRRFNLSALAGPGWAHDFNTKGNDMTANFAINAEYMLNKHIALYVGPTIFYGLTDDGGGLEFNINRSVLQLNGGVVYKFNKTQFSKTKYITLEEFNRLNATVNNLRKDLSNMPKEVIKEVPGETKVVYVVPAIGFDLNKSTLDYKTMANISTIAKLGRPVKVTGYASRDGFVGNETLSMARAKAVMEALVDAGLDRDLITIEAKGDTEQPYTPTEANRVATIEVQ
jgi:hypothetical protein